MSSTTTTSSHNIPVPTPQHVLIIGSGLAGPCLALSLANNSPPIRSTIYEIRPSPSPGGGSISLGPNALLVLDRYARVLPELIKKGYTYDKFGAYSDQGEQFGVIRVGLREEQEDPNSTSNSTSGKSKAKPAAGYPALRIMRTELHQVLTDAIEVKRSQGLIDIRYGMKLVAVEDHDPEGQGAGVVARFEDGTVARGDILIGADGVHSQVRRHVLGLDVDLDKDEGNRVGSNSVEPGYDGVCIVYGFVDGGAAKGKDGEGGGSEAVTKTSAGAGTGTGTVTTETSGSKIDPSSTGTGFTLPGFMFTPSGIFMAIPHEPTGRSLAWAITKPVPHPDVPTRPGQTEQDHKRAIRAEWSRLESEGTIVRSAIEDYACVGDPTVRDLLDRADVPGSKVWPAYSIPRMKTWHRGRVGTIGDAAHGLPPNGQGSGLAFEDAAVLARLLGSVSSGSFLLPGTSTVDYSALLDRFEALRHPRIDSLREKTKTAHKAGKVKTDGAWIWWAKKWAFRGFFWFNKGVLEHTKETGYDVDQLDLAA